MKYYNQVAFQDLTRSGLARPDPLFLIFDIWTSQIQYSFVNTYFNKTCSLFVLFSHNVVHVGLIVFVHALFTVFKLYICSFQ